MSYELELIRKEVTDLSTTMYELKADMKWLIEAKKESIIDRKEIKDKIFSCSACKDGGSIVNDVTAADKKSSKALIVSVIALGSVSGLSAMIIFHLFGISM